MGNKPYAAQSTGTDQTSGSDIQSTDSDVTGTRITEPNGLFHSPSFAETAPIQSSTRSERQFRESELAAASTQPVSPQRLVDQITNTLFGASLLDAVDAIVSLNQRRKQEQISSRDVDDHTTDLEAADQSPATAVFAGVKQSTVVSQPNLSGFVPYLPHRTDALIQKAVQFLWDARSSAGDGSREDQIRSAALSPPEEFRSDWLDPCDVDPELLAQPGLHFISRPLLFDLVAETVEQIYAGEDRDSRAVVVASRADQSTPRVTSSQFRLWNGPVRPQTFDRLLQVVRKQVQHNLELRASWTASERHPNLNGPRRLPPGLNKLSKTVQWTLSKKTFLEGVLELDMREEESSWFAYTAEETRVKSSLADQLWQEVLHDALDAMLRCSRGSGSTVTLVPT